MSSESISDHVSPFLFRSCLGCAYSQIYSRDRLHRVFLQLWWLGVHTGSTQGGSTHLACFGVLLSKGSVVTGRGLSRGFPRGWIGGFDLRMLLIEMHDLFARQLELQLDDDRPSHVFGFAMVMPMFMDEINLYTTLISIKGLLYMCNSCFMLGLIHQIRWKTLGSSLSIHGLINLGGVL